ncbi:DUF1796 family putative cysteine peptidase [Paenibacillus beijingensis]|uniref:DUF1796 family putative cysteine peptidase n=1 Tax=Paenibacillus beijingensis TaxID=1126833 RepID=UPI00069841DE|nr:DUF1796 family putative cysteine peptidase [Paenibacillus beijingensis]
MKLSELEKSYDYFISLGANCMPALQLEKLNLKQATLPLDWFVTPSSPKVAYMLLTRFANFMEQPNLIVKYPHDGLGTYIVEDFIHNTLSFHDFHINENTPTSLTGYPKFREKMDRRINRFYKLLKDKQSFLFIRTQVGSQSAEDVRLLKAAIDSAVGPGKTAHLLIINYLHHVLQINELETGINGVCVVEAPYHGDENMHETFRQLLQGMSLTGADSLVHSAESETAASPSALEPEAAITKPDSNAPEPTVKQGAKWLAKLRQLFGRNN